MATRISGFVRMSITYRDGHGAGGPMGYFRRPFYDIRVREVGSNLRMRLELDADRSDARHVAADSSEAYTLIAAEVVRYLFASDEQWSVSRHIETPSRCVFWALVDA